MSGQPDARSPRPLWGKYRGKVLDNEDPLELHRMLVDVPALQGVEQSWALPCVPYAGPQVGFCMLPPIGANVWVEFEAGDPSKPIWTGCFWADDERPTEAQTPDQKVLKTPSFTLVIDDTEGGGGMKLVVDSPAVDVAVSVTIDGSGLTVQTSEATLTLTPDQISAGIDPTTATLTDSSVAIDTEGTVTVDADSVDVTADVDVTGAVTITGDVDVTGATTITGDVGITGATQMEGDLDVSGAVDVTGDTAFVGVVAVAGDVAVAGAVEVAGDLTALAAEVAVP
jgi:hypothetical protein